MILTDQQIEYISNNLKFYGIKSDELRNDVLDHICTFIENETFEDFETAYKEAIKNFGGYNEMRMMETETYLLTSFRKNMFRRRLLYIFGFLSLNSVFSGMLFKLMHWPGASIILFSGFLLLIFIFLPIAFYHKYKTVYQKEILR